MRLETEHLFITELTLDMVSDIQQNSLDEDNRRFVPDEVFETYEDAKETVEWLMSQYATNDGPLLYPIFTKDKNENIGYVQLVPLEKENRWELGYHIAKKYTGKGYATEAAKAFLPYISEKIGISQVYGICLQENAASCHILNKLGFEPHFVGRGDYQNEKREIFIGIWNK